MNKLFIILLLLLIIYYYLLIRNNNKEYFTNDINNITYNDMFKKYKLNNIYNKKTNFGDIIIAKIKNMGNV